MRHLCVIEEMLLVDVFDLDFHKIVAYGYHSTIYHDHTCTNILLAEVSIKSQMLNHKCSVL